MIAAHGLSGNIAALQDAPENHMCAFTTWIAVHIKILSAISWKYHLARNRVNEGQLLESALNS
jgi:hypothetical protein